MKEEKFSSVKALRTTSFINKIKYRSPSSDRILKTWSGEKAHYKGNPRFRWMSIKRVRVNEKLILTTLKFMEQWYSALTLIKTNLTKAK